MSLAQEKKRKIDSIWEEMNAPSERPAKAARPEAPRPESAAPQAENSRPQDDGKEVRRAAPRRRASRFSKIAEMVEQRRAKKENTLDKARREWSGFVAEQGIREDLDQANKDGFVERQEFLSRVNERTYERSRQK
ncbi:hypothetical protein DL89DRAFT_264611 [Linderina pennispora]|uniref:SWR1-complex protein 5 n=1 Tax=Linderina pennispora TaxID=61395 RepID=A0A1Y1WMQ4_9FUNG|nr:uncharacterized protein DL89DRAFT_264611 [Linderina pennispora]ORX74821.1 hypothetical protein DL89DRAFT_264611 [Linderina pennispora]